MRNAAERRGRGDGKSWLGYKMDLRRRDLVCREEDSGSGGVRTWVNEVVERAM